MKRAPHVFTFFLLALMLGSCSRALQMESLPAATEIEIDGFRNDWAGQFSVPKYQKFAIAVSHSKNYVYLAMSSLDRTFMWQINVSGFTIWMDPSGKKKEVVGLRYIGRMGEFRSRWRSTSEKPGLGRDLDQGILGAEGGRQGLGPLKGELDLIILDKDKRQRLGPPDLLASASSNEDGLFIEFQIPLSLLGKDYVSGEPLGIGFISEFERSDGAKGGAGRDQMDGGDMPGGRGQMGGDRSGGMGRQQSVGRPAGGAGSLSQNDVDFWMKVSLVKP